MRKIGKDINDRKRNIQRKKEIDIEKRTEDKRKEEKGNERKRKEDR